MQELIDYWPNILKYLWIFDFATLSVFGVIALFKSRANSSLITQILVVLISGIIVQYEALLLDVSFDKTNEGIVWGWVVGFVVMDCVIATCCYVLYLSIKSQLNSSHYRYSCLLLVVCFIGVVVYLQYVTLQPEQQVMNYKLWILIAFCFGGMLLDTLFIFALLRLHRFLNCSLGLLARVYIVVFSVSACLLFLLFNIKFIFETQQLDSMYQVIQISINMLVTAIGLMIAIFAAYNILIKKNEKGLLWSI